MALKFTRVTEDEGELGRILMRDFMPEYRSGYLRMGPEKVVMPEYYLKFSELIRQMEVNQEDVWVMSHPKTGTTWVQEMVWCIANDLDFERAKQLFLPERFPFLEYTPLFDYRDIVLRIPELKLPLFASDSVQYVTDQKSPRFIKTHLPWSMLPQQILDGTKQIKMIYVCRNAKDTCMSYYNHCVLMEGYQGNFEDFCTLFMGDSVCFGPFWSHVLKFWERRDQSNILFLKYEDMKKDLPAVIRQTASFLEQTLTEDQVDLLADHLSFESMKDNRSVNYEEFIEINRKFGLVPAGGQFMRSGTVGDWKGKMTGELIAKFDKWTSDNLEGTGLKF